MELQITLIGFWFKPADHLVDEIERGIVWNVLKDVIPSSMV